jgi:hypothetical protein
MIMNREIESPAKTKFIAVLEFRFLVILFIEVARNLMERTEIVGVHYYYIDQLLDLCTCHMKEASLLYQNETYLHTKYEVGPVVN